MATIDLEKKYKKDTLGYHYVMAQAFFGKDSSALKFLQEKADESEKGFYELVIMPERQVVNLLFNIHCEGVSGDEE